VAGWAVNPSTNALLDAGKNSTADLSAACNALLSDNQIGEIYVIKNDPNCTTCLRMAIYDTTAGIAPGRVSNPGKATWVCNKGAQAAPVRDCPPIVPNSKWRDCSASGNPASVGYVTGTDTNYVAGWAVNPSTNALLDAGKNSTADLSAACNALLSDNQIGEIYVIKNDPNCTTCMRMAIYDTTAGIAPGHVSNPGKATWVCGKGGQAAAQPPPSRNCSAAPAPAPSPSPSPSPSIQASGAERLAAHAILVWGALAVASM